MNLKELSDLAIKRLEVEAIDINTIRDEDGFETSFEPILHREKAEEILLDFIMGEVSGIGGDGTEKLLMALYGKSDASVTSKCLGGSNAKMLHDAAELIVDLRRQLHELNMKEIMQ